jgi:hypothetical protein
MSSLPYPAPDVEGGKTYRSTSNDHPDLAAGRAHDLVELGAHPRNQRQAVVLGQGGQQVLDRLVGRGHAGGLLELGDDLALVGLGERRGPQDRRQLGVLADDVLEGGQVLGGLVEGGGLDCCCVL